ncbi:EamA family transporter [Cellulomonas carbonis]|uniref:Permease n=1 Tax=Cellulomonas carbonis T26 TaxID=947969 RepID=A0A0A0BWK0_9CELL|nr:EamA family transporter [Cellulomonas carbonis]KGM11559.1 permease [Cellulomonas carbonis T26]GGC06655.1 permease [Cellulomonas carbonis]
MTTAPSSTAPGAQEGAGSAGRAAVGVAAVVVASLLFAVNGTVSKIAMQSGLSPTRLVELRSLGSAVVLVAAVLVVAPRTRLPGRRELAGLAVLGVVGMAMVQWLYFVAISRLPVGLALLVEYTAPVLVALWARFVLREDVRARLWWALAACLAGLALVAQVGRGVTLDAVGLLAAGAAAVSLATYYLLGDRLVRRRDPLSTQAWSMVFAAVFWVVLQPLWTFDAAVLRDDVALPGAAEGVVLPLWALVAWIVLLGTVVPYVLVLAGVARLGAARTGVIGMLEPVAAAATAWLVLGESMTPVQLLGGAVVLAGVTAAETARSTHAARPAPDAVVST